MSKEETKSARQFKLPFELSRVLTWELSKQPVELQSRTFKSARPTVKQHKRINKQQCKPHLQPVHCIHSILQQCAERSMAPRLGSITPHDGKPKRIQNIQ